VTETDTYRYDDDAAAIEDFFARGFTDGLPVIPPTPERVEAMLGGFAPDLLLGEVPTRNVEVTAEKFRLSETERKSVLRHLTTEGALTRWGLVNALTRTAEDVESYDRATELERCGGQVIELPRRDWERIAQAV